MDASRLDRPATGTRFRARLGFLPPCPYNATNRSG